MALLIISLVLLLIGPVVYRVADRARGSLSALDGFVMVTITGLVVVHIVPHAMESAGWWAVGVALLGFFGPGLVERTLERAARQAHAATLALAMVGLGLHAFFDGVGLASPVHGSADGDISVLAIAVVLHRLPVAITVWAILRPIIGPRFAAGVLAGIGVATVIGYGAGDSAGHMIGAGWLGLLQALIAGSLLHVVIHRPGHSADPDPKASNLYAGFGALFGLAAVAALSDTHVPHYVDHAAGFGATFITLTLESAPALLLAFALAGIVQVLLPTASLRWMRTGRPMSESVRGVVFGLPLPICSCGVIPLYQTLIVQGVPATAAMAFLVATPELGLDAILISLPLLGTELTIIRVVCAGFVALVIGWLIGQLVRPFEAKQQASRLPTAASRGWMSRLRDGLRFGFGEIVDHVGPWLILGLAIAALVEPLLEGAWLAVIPWGLDVVLFAVLGMPSYVCASGATPLVAVLIHKGVSPGAAIAFLLAGPATNVTTFGLLGKLHGRKVALAFGGAIALLSIGLGIAVNALLPELQPSALDPHSEQKTNWVGIASTAALAVVFALSILRQGPRQFIGQVIAPYGSDDHDHDHDDHDHG